MIYKVVEFLRSNLASYVSSTLGSGAVVNANIANYQEGRDNTMEDKLVLTLVNLQEEAANKEKAHYSLRGDQITYRKPPIYFTFYLLVSAPFQNYDSGLRAMTYAAEFFQQQRLFTYRRNPVDEVEPFSLTDQEKEQLEITIDFHSLNFEEINHLWGSLGGKQLPFLLYKGRFIPIQANQPYAEGAPIQEIETYQP